MLALLQATGLRRALEYRRAAVLHGQVWRLLTGNLVHLGWVHLARDVAGLFLIWDLVANSLERSSRLWVLCVCGLAVGLGLLASTRRSSGTSGYRVCSSDSFAPARSASCASARRMPARCSSERPRSLPGLCRRPPCRTPGAYPIILSSRSRAFGAMPAPWAAESSRTGWQDPPRSGWRRRSVPAARLVYIHPSSVHASPWYSRRVSTMPHAGCVCRPERAVRAVKRREEDCRSA